MRAAVLGTGMVGVALAGGLTRIGHDVVMGTRDPDGKSVDGYDGQLATFADAVADADIVLLALSGAVTIDVVTALAESLSWKVVVDATNPLDFSGGMPPTLSVFGTDSLGEQVQRAAPSARVVKALNTINADVMVDPSLVPGASLFLAGEDAAAKDQVRALLRELGWADEAFIDLGGIVASRATEAYVLTWLALFTSTGTPYVGVKVVRA